ncbi:MAG: FtsX-like permease family protein [Planctomycetia bacterium]|nr:FtsX-like permease family protein [Planctomycetia bacterium]
MYIYLLCIRYLRTRYIALASVVSVMLGVATMIVVNSVMSGFTQEMQKRLHGIQGDVTLESISSSGFPDAEGHMAEIKKILGEDVIAMTPLCTTAGIMNFRFAGQWYTQEVIIIGIDENTKGAVGDFSNYLQHPENRKQLSFDLREGGYDVYDHQAVISQTGILGKLTTWFAELGGRDTEKEPIFQKNVKPRHDMQDAGWEHRRIRYSPVFSEWESYGYPPPTAPKTLPAPVPLPNVHGTPSSMRGESPSENDVPSEGNDAERIPSSLNSFSPEDIKEDIKKELPDLASAETEYSFETESQENTPRNENKGNSPAPFTEENVLSLNLSETENVPDKTQEVTDAEYVSGKMGEITDTTVPFSPVGNPAPSVPLHAPEENTSTYNVPQEVGTSGVPSGETPPYLSESMDLPEGTDVADVPGSTGFSENGENSHHFEGDPFGQAQLEKVYDPTKEQMPGAIVGMGLAMRRKEGDEIFVLRPGDDFKLTFPTNGTPPDGVTANFTCVDLYESKMSETDGHFIFLPLRKMQELRGMADAADPRMNRVNRIQMTLREGASLEEARDKLNRIFDPLRYQAYTWKDNKIAILQAVELETQILNILLFMIIAVSGFGILAIFFMVVVEKTRDIGILKALGASSGGVMCIFLAYGLSLGIVGAGMGCVMGLLFVYNINEIADLLSQMLGHEVFNPDIYFFHQIPYDVNPWTVTWIVAGALLIAVLASIFPAWRAASLQPVESLRFE